MLVQVLMNQQGYQLNPIQSLYYVSPACFVCLVVPFLVLEAPLMQDRSTWTLRPWRAAPASCAPRAFERLFELPFFGLRELPRAASALPGRAPARPLYTPCLHVQVSGGKRCHCFFPQPCCVFADRQNERADDEHRGRHQGLARSRCSCPHPQGPSWLHLRGMVSDSCPRLRCPRRMLIWMSMKMFTAPVTPLNLIGYTVAFFGVCWYNYSKMQNIKAKATVVSKDEEQPADGAKDQKGSQ